MFLEQLGKSNGQINFFFGFHLSISKTFVGGGPRINIKGQDLKFCVNLYTNIYFFHKLRGAMPPPPPSPMIGPSLFPLPSKQATRFQGS